MITKEKFSDNANFIPESQFPFSIENIENMIEIKKQAGWYWQQLAQFYMWDVIPNLTENVLFISAAAERSKFIEVNLEDCYFLQLSTHLR
jgi:hypothetical protein